MPLLDHFHPPLSQRRQWHSFHHAWAAVIAFDDRVNDPIEVLAKLCANYSTAKIAILVHHGDAHPLRARDDTASGLAITSDELHEGGLAGAVPANHAPAFTTFDLEGDTGEECVSAEDYGEVGCGD